MQASEIKIGMEVYYEDIKGLGFRPESYTVLSEAWNQCGTDCCLLEGMSGGVDISRLKAVV